MRKTNEEIAALKENWKKDPHWDIEDTEGFGEHRVELIEYRMQMQAEWITQEEERIEHRARVIEIETGVIATGPAQFIKTYAEIEREVEQGNQSGDKIQILSAQVHATLLLAAQTQRIADLMQCQMEEQILGRESEHNVQLYTIKQ